MKLKVDARSSTRRRDGVKDTKGDIGDSIEPAEASKVRGADSSRRAARLVKPGSWRRHIDRRERVSLMLHDTTERDLFDNKITLQLRP